MNLLKTSRREVEIGKRPLIMGILNITPDSFSDGGVFLGPEVAVERALAMEAEGADIIDVGGESTRPGSEGISTECELERIAPVMKALGEKLQIPISIDTTKSEVARIAIDLGAEIINDISALRFDSRMVDVALKSKAAVVLMHMRGTPKTMQTGDLDYGDVVDEIISFLEQRIHDAVSKGISLEQLVIDPGIGFGKRMDDNVRILKYLHDFKPIGLPLLVGPSRKGFIGQITGEEKPAERLGGTAAAVALAVANGADIIRVHDVRFMKNAADMAYAISRADTDARQMQQ